MKLDKLTKCDVLINCESISYNMNLGKMLTKNLNKKVNGGCFDAIPFTKSLVTKQEITWIS